MYTRKSIKKEPTRRCDHPRCHKEGLYKAPKDRTLKEHYWFCLEHVQEYNKNWNYYAGFNPEQIEAEIRLDSVGHRPTWRVNDLYSNRLKDPFDILGLSGMRRKGSRSKQNLSMDVKHIEAMKTLNLTPPLDVEELKKKYKTLAKKYHPDRNGGDKKAEEKFKEITAAYRLLLKVLKKE